MLSEKRCPQPVFHVCFDDETPLQTVASEALEADAAADRS